MFMLLCSLFSWDVMKLIDDFLKNYKSLSDIRTCRFYLRYLNHYMGIVTEDYNINDHASCIRAIKNTVTKYAQTEPLQNGLLVELDSACGANVLPKDKFDWINESERAAFWLWGYICLSDDLVIWNGFNWGINDGLNWYNRLGLSKSPSNHKERMKLIVLFFDGVIVQAGEGLKYQLMERLKNKWKVKYNNPLPVKWMPDDEDTVSWVWDNFKNRGDDTVYLSQSGMSHFVTWFMPFNHAERLLAVRAALDLWDNDSDSKKLFLLNLNKAWNQKKLRQSRTDKKALNTYIKNETKMRLDILATHYNMRISDVLEKIINETYRNQIKSDK